MKIPVSLKEKAERVHGAEGRHWFASLPELIGECRERWSLKLGEPFEHLSYNLVMPGRTDRGAEVVLKVGVPCREMVTEASALDFFGGVGAVRLIDHDAQRGMLLMERIVPGTSLYESRGDAEATRVAARLMRRLWRVAPAEHAFPSLAEWFGAFERLRSRCDGGSGPFPSEVIARAEREFAELDASCMERVVLHGDLHHANILWSARDGWTAIDPKGICGERGYEVGSFMLNRLPAGASESVTLKTLERRLTIFAEELEIERARLARWSFCHAVLSAVWDFEESADWRDTIRLAHMLERLD